ncbi:hypothetical protein PPERSA_13119 [Pseudocohnilembus persalinus]|uniref:Flavin-containing monooxygenase n=1 Tax=Pseudocohnilembus persalinus TaxID=266149 RepID=A0A0V0QXA6_PSEPJ|nr:hypothetical protein PPERSA_13119 [Pseudocohnilembus persalinus]|eukprot:KRX06640.1 hypothetical protein PPERSA_13119 [Pseudocohnilembus persalinus]
MDSKIAKFQGALNTPYTPEFKGKNKFQGEKMHSAQFNTNYDFTNKKVAIVGSAASAIQLAPIIAKQVKDLKSLKKKFQKQIISKTKFLPPLEQKKLIPQYDVGCKRVLKSNHYFPMFKNKNVHLIDEKIQEFTENSIIFQQQNGQNNKNQNEIQIDTIIFATGFVLADVQFEVIGKNNLTLKQYWNKFPKAYKSAFVPNFPNFILLLGPNSGLGHSSMIFMLESQMHYVTQILEQIISGQKQEIEIKEEILENELNHHNKKAKNSIWLQGNCSSWYKNESGQLFTLFVGFCTEFWWKMRKINLSEFKIK